MVPPKGSGPKPNPNMPRCPGSGTRPLCTAAIVEDMKTLKVISLCSNAKDFKQTHLVKVNLSIIIRHFELLSHHSMNVTETNASYAYIIIIQITHPLFSSPF